MIQPNELRIGDIFYFKGELTAITYAYLYEFVKGNVHLVPVELTPDILEAAGFKYNQLTENYEIFIDFEGLIALNKYDYSIFIGADNEDRGYTGRTSTACKYLHQLQNLYYCLTGEELQIDLTKLNK